MSLINIINESFDKRNKSILTESKLTQLRKAFGEVADSYDTEELLGSIFPQFARKAYKIVKNHGYSGVFSEIDTQGDLGDDFFYANKDGKAYMGSYNYQQELDDITEIVLFGKATTYKELIDELAEWYANLILSKLEFDSDGEWDESEWVISEGYTKSSKANDDDLDENIFIKKQKRKSQKLKETTESNSKNIKKDSKFLDKVKVTKNRSLHEYFDYGEAEDFDELGDMLDQSGDLIHEAAEKLGFKDFEWEDSVQGPHGRSDFWITGDDGTRLHAKVDFSETWVTDLDEAIMLLDNLEWKDASDDSDDDDLDDTEEDYPVLLKQSFGYLLDASRELGLKDFDYDYDPSWIDTTLRYIDRDGNKRQAYFDSVWDVFFTNKEAAMSFLKSIDWKVVDDEDNDLDEDLDTQSKVSSEIAELKGAFKNEDIDLYELQDLVDDLYYDFSNKAFKIVEREGFAGVYAEPSTQGGIGDDFFTAYKGDVRYEGQYDYEEELNDIANIVINSNAKNREELIDELAKWYADLILDCIEPYEDDLDENTQAKKQKHKSKNLTEAQGDFNPATLKKYGVVRDPANDFVDDGDRFTAYLYKGVIPIRYLKSKGQVYLSIAFDDLGDVNYDEYKNFGSYQDSDKYNGVPADSVDIEDFVSILERAKKDYEEFKASVKAPNIDDYKAFRKVYADYFKKVLERAKKLIADNIDTIADLSDYELKKIFEYYKSIKSQLSRWINDDAISQMSPSAIRHDLSSESIERQKKQIANIDDYFYLRYIRDYIEGDKAK